MCLFLSSCRIYFKFSLYFMGNMEICPALYKNEKKNAKAFIFFFFATLLYGVLFGYYIVIPCQLTLCYPSSDWVLNQFTLDSILGCKNVRSGKWIVWITNYYLFLDKTGISDSCVLRTYRKYAIVLVLVAAIVTPPDVVSQTIVAIPMLLIYEASIFISVLVTKK
jgi:sec-independent protein translocase protein TatC